MPIYKTFSQRRAEAERAKTGAPDVFEYDKLPEQFRHQAWYILYRMIGPGTVIGPLSWSQAGAFKIWESVSSHLVESLGLPGLGSPRPDEACRRFLLESRTDQCLDLIEIAFRVELRSSSDARQQLNERFLQHRLGYEFVNGQIIRRDESAVHELAVRPALQLISAPGWKAVETEFLKAYDCYRQGPSHYKDAIDNAAKSFESALKVTCAKLGLTPPDGKQTAGPLLTALFASSAVPDFLRSQADHLRGAMEGLATLGNRMGRHGDGIEIQQVPKHYVELALHLAATNIVFLANVAEADP